MHRAPQEHGAGEFRYAELEIESSKEGIHFSLLWKELQLEDRAALVIQETLDVLNQVGLQCHTSSETFSKCMRCIKLRLPLEAPAHAGWWGALNRKEAERLLKKREVGTFLLREGDEETKRLEWTVQKNNPFPVRCYVMTLLEEKGKISDKVLVQTAGGWALYTDNLELGSYAFKSLSAAIASCGGKTPYKTLRKAA